MRIAAETWPLEKPFVISRGSRVDTEVVKVMIVDGNCEGVGEGVPTPRYRETTASVIEQIESIRADIANGIDRNTLQKLLPAGAARNAVDCALWDLAAKQQVQTVGALSGLGWPSEAVSAQTISIGTVAEMGEAAAMFRDYPVIKIKLDSTDVLQRVTVIRKNAPDAELLIDANESWSFDLLSQFAPELSTLGVAMIEQPLRAGEDAALVNYQCPVPLFADESCHTSADLPELVYKYHGINIKLDKTGGLTEAIVLLNEARALDLAVMVGCMVSTSLGIAPAMLLAAHADYADLDAPTLLAKDRKVKLTSTHGRIGAIPAGLWGHSS